eukprot:7343054-Prymnesium_polylepis.1
MHPRLAATAAFYRQQYHFVTEWSKPFSHPPQLFEVGNSTPTTSGSAPDMYSSNHSSFRKHSRGVPLVLAKPLASSRSAYHTAILIPCTDCTACVADVV